MKIFRKSLYLLCFFLLISGFANADYPEYTQKLESLDISVDEIKEKKSVSRYNLARILNLVTCFDCRYPDQERKEKLDKSWFENFKAEPGNNFSDIGYEDSYYNGTQYYYCVTYAGYKDYMNGYPQKTSNVCPGEFCGTNNTIVSELLQVSFNILSRQVYDKYSADWGQIKGYLDSLDEGSSEYRNFNENDVSIINENAEECDKSSCQISSPEQFRAYVKYCSWNLEECGFTEFSSLEEGQWPIGVVNVLYQEDVMDEEQINQLSVDNPINGEKLLNYLYRLSLKTDCSFDDDYDDDGVKNRNDNCINTYDPDQSDLDGDGVGDVCDDDIDGDGAKNPVGIVDDEGNINRELLPQNKDNCLFVPNPEQTDSNNNGIGDECDDLDDNSRSLEIQGEPLVGETSLEVNFEANVEGKCKNVEWDFGDGVWGEGDTTSHVYSEPGKYNVLAKCERPNGKYSTAKLVVNVGENKDSKIAFQAKGNPLRGEAPLVISLWPEYYGNVETIDRIIEDNSERISSDSDYGWRFENTGFYEVVADAYNDKGERVAYSKLNVEVTEEGEISVGSNLRADKLRPQIGESVQFSTEREGFSMSDVEKIHWDFGDGNSFFEKTFEIRKKYKSTGKKLVKQKIFLDDGEVMENVLSIYVQDAEQKEEKGTQLAADPLVQEVGKSIDFELIPENIEISEISKLNWKFGDGTTYSFGEDFASNFTQNYGYSSPGTYKVRAELILEDSEYFINEATITVIGEEKCRGDLSEYDCDMDGDGIPDICDEDIDGDGVDNLLGLIKYEKEDCSIGEENIRGNRLKEEENLAAEGEDIDNCPFSENSEQLDIDGDGKGDVCDDEGEELDTDNDGISNEEDVCPNVPEDFDGVEDKDGCPEVGVLNDDIGSFVQVENCITCPCHSADFASQLWKGDKIRALLLDPSGKKIYRYSPEKTVEEEVNVDENN